MGKQLLLASASELNTGISLQQDEGDGSYKVLKVKAGAEVSALVLADGIVEFDDAKLVFDRHAGLLFNEAGYKAKGE